MPRHRTLAAAAAHRRRPNARNDARRRRPSAVRGPRQAGRLHVDRLQDLRTTAAHQAGPPARPATAPPGSAGAYDWKQPFDVLGSCPVCGTAEWSWCNRSTDSDPCGAQGRPDAGRLDSARRGSCGRMTWGTATRTPRRTVVRVNESEADFLLAGRLEYAATLQKELLAFRAKVTLAANETFEAARAGPRRPCPCRGDGRVAGGAQRQDPGPTVIREESRGVRRPHHDSGPRRRGWFGLSSR